MGLEPLGRLLIALGVGIALLGALFLLLSKLGVSSMPGNVVFRGERITVLIPIGLSILVSVLLTVVLNLILRR